MYEFKQDHEYYDAIAPDMPNISDIMVEYNKVFGEVCSTYEAENIQRYYRDKLISAIRHSARKPYFDKQYKELSEEDKKITIPTSSDYGKKPLLKDIVEDFKLKYAKEAAEIANQERRMKLTGLRRFAEWNGKQDSELINKFVDTYQNNDSNSMTLLFGQWNCSEDLRLKIIEEVYNEASDLVDSPINKDDFIKNAIERHGGYFSGLAGDGERALRTIFAVLSSFEAMTKEEGVEL
tara:strand:- start:44911 stop:45618 length:708 start_codon:yes stop_codon:yes gene_type:complete